MICTERDHRRAHVPRNEQTSRPPSQAVLAELAMRSLIMVVGPRAVGKNLVIDTLVGNYPEFGRVSSRQSPDDTLDTLYPNDYNILSTPEDDVLRLEELPLGSKHLIGLVANPGDWRTWFRRSSSGNSAYRRRLDLEEAASSLDWLLMQRDAHIIMNEANAPETAADNIRSAVLHKPPIDDHQSVEYLEQLLRAVKQEQGMVR